MTPPETRGRALVGRLRRLGLADRARVVRALGSEASLSFDLDWPSWAHDGQKEPPGPWRVWTIMAGRGFGKTRAGAEWLAARIAAGRDLAIALVGATLEDARKVMVEGRSGLLAIAGHLVDDWYPSRGLLRFKQGSQAQLYSGHTPELLRGPEHHLAWCDELAKWEKAQDCWDMLQLGMRLGDAPQILVTTTPRPGPVLSGIMAAKSSVTSGGPTRANPHLPDAFVDAVEGLYAGTRLGRQELEGELLSDTPGALWTVELIERCRTPNPPRALLGEGDRPAEPDGGGEAAPPSALRAATSPSEARGGFQRVVIGVDPPSGDGTCGIIACALDADGIAHVLADHSVTARSPEGWAQAVAEAARLHGAGLVVAEDNQGGAMVAAVLRGADATLRVKPVTARLAKAERAIPIAQRFEAGRVRLHGRFPELEAELGGLIAGGDYEGPGKSPDRADAMVWALSELMLEKGRVEPRIRVL